MLPVTMRAAVVVAVLIALPVVAHAAGKATVRGAEAVNVRREPSTDSPSIVAIRKGSAVKVEKVIGAWALVTLQSGTQGYVKAVFLQLPPGIVVEPEAQLAAITPADTPAAAPTETAVATPETQPEAARR